MQDGKLLSKQMRRASLNQACDICGKRVGIGTNEQMHMIWLDRQPQYFPMLLLGHLMDNLL